MAPGNQSVTTPVDPDHKDPVTPDVDRIIRERLGDTGPTRSWEEFYAEEKKRPSQRPSPVEPPGAPPGAGRR